MTWLFWLSAAFIAYVYVGYPLLAWLRSRWRPRPWRQEEIFPALSVVMAVRNAGELIEAKLRSLFALDYPDDKLEIIVVSDGSQDQTHSLLARQSDKRLRVFQYPDHRGKAAALNLGIRQADGDIVVFTDVRQDLEPQSLRLLVSNFADPSVGCAAGELVIREAGQPDPQAGVGLYWRYEKGIRQCEGAVDSTVGASGALYAVRRELLAPLPEGTILDDVYLPLQVVRQGYRSVYEARARAWDSPSTSAGVEFGRKVRTLTGNYQLLQIAPWLLRRENRLRFQFISHKLLRLWVPLFLAPLLVSSWALAAQPFYLAVALLQAAFYACAGLGLLLRGKALGRLLGVPAAFCLLNGAAVMGLVNFLFRREPLWQVWVPATPGKSPRRE